MTDDARAPERYECTVERDGSITLPAQLLREYGWVPGDDLAMDVINGAIVVRREDNASN